jgi:hypothetical protein
VSIPGHGTTSSFIDDLCHTLPFDFKRALSVATTYGLINPSATNRFPIVDILSLISLDMIFNIYQRSVCLVVMVDRKRIIHRLSLFFDYKANPNRENNAKTCLNQV